MDTLSRKLHSSVSLFQNEGIKGLILQKVLDRFMHGYWKNKIYWTPRRLYVPLSKVQIDRPIFLLGTQGGGGTFLSRIIRRHPDVCYITGNKRFWAGEDELHNKRRFKHLPDDWVLRSPGYRNLLGIEKYHPKFGYERSWLYCTNELLTAYQRTEHNWSPEVEAALVREIKRCIRAYAIDIRRARFHDMSQTYAVKIGLLRKCLPGGRFILMLRNPYAMCWREVTRKVRKYNFFERRPSQAEALKLAAEHWKNTFSVALDDLEGHNDSITLRFEDLLFNLRYWIEKIMKFAELEDGFDLDLIIGGSFPIGSVDRNKWFPIRTTVNDIYLQEIPSWACDIIEAHCSELAKDFEYPRPR